MAHTLHIVQIGRGTVGAALVDQIAAQRRALADGLGVDLVYAGIAGRACGVFDVKGVRLEGWRQAVEAGRGFGGAAALVKKAKEAAGRLAGAVVLVDATAEDGMAGLYGEALGAGFHVVSCNKKPLAGPLADYRKVKEAARVAGRAWLYEVTVGAGLPVIGTLRGLLDSGDRIESIEGCFSGTLNFLCTELDRGGTFSEVLGRARSLGYTEPDPRDDLDGMDVARKALILAREAGLLLEPPDVRLEPFCPVDRVPAVEAFVAGSPAQDAPLARRWRDAAARGRRLRYVASVDGGCGAALREVPAESALGRLAGPENVFSFRTARYATHPLVVSGPGAGPAVTAAGAFADIVTIARAVALGVRGGAA
jgi:aspartokinase/homoserine dehydrogenase 1